MGVVRCMIYGKGIYLREMIKDDINMIYDLCVNDEVLQYEGINNSIVSKEYLIENYKYFKVNDRKYYAIINCKGMMVGFISYRRSHYVNDVYYISIAIGKQYWRMRYGERSIKAMLRYLFKNKKAHKVELEVMENNIPAIKCYEKCGFTEEGRRREKCYYKGKYVDTVLMGILENEYRERK